MGYGCGMNRKRHQSVLPPLAFGSRRAMVDRTPQEMQDRVEKLTRWVTRQDAAAHDQPFEYRAVAASLAHLKLIAASSTPTTMVVDAQEHSLVLPLNGQFKTRIENRSFDYGAGQAAMLQPPGYRDSEGGVKSALIVSFEEAQLNKTMKAMLGNRWENSSSRLDIPALFNLRAGSVDFERVFRSLCLQVDQFEGEPAALHAMGVSDSFYRAMAILLNQELLISRSEPETQKGLDHVCDYIIGHIAESITLTDLESMSGLSARALQYAFLKRFNCTPMQWVRQRKAEHARTLLLQGGESITVASVAAQCGFANFSKFSLFYQSIFQEKPSETLKRALSKK